MARAGGGVPGGRRCPGTLRAVEAYGGVEVQGTALLELGDLAVRDAKMLGEFPAGGRRERSCVASVIAPAIRDDDSAVRSRLRVAHV